MSASTRAKAAAAVASASVLVIGWQASHAVGGASPTREPGTGATTSNPTTMPTSMPPTSGATSSPATSPAAGGRPARVPGGRPQRGGAPGGATIPVTLDVPAGASGTWTGTEATHRYGSVTVTVTLANGRITGLDESVVSDGDHTSDEINDSSVPQLRSAILAAATGQVSTISGATYTTQAYLTSLQSALDQAG